MGDAEVEARGSVSIGSVLASVGAGVPLGGWLREV